MSLPCLDQSSCKEDVLLTGIQLGIVKALVHTVYLCSGVVSGFVTAAVRPHLPNDSEEGNFIHL